MFTEWMSERLKKQDISIMRYHVYDGYFLIYLVAGVTMLTPIQQNQLTHVYGAYSQLQNWIERYKNNPKFKFIAGMVMKFNDERPDEVLYYATQGVEIDKSEV